MTDDKEIKHLIEHGKQVGYLTFEEIYHHLPFLEMTASEMDDFFVTLSELSIPVKEKNEAEIPLLGKQQSSTTEEDLELRMEDPIRMYLSKSANLLCLCARMS